MTLILGIDPGLQLTGWGIIRANGNALSYVASGVIKTSNTLPLPQRLKTIHDTLLKVLNSYKIETAAIEETFVNMNSQSSIKLCHARAAAMLTISINEIELVEYSTRLIKKSVTGSGKADKEQIIRMISLLMPGLHIKSEDEADAIACAICHSSFIRKVA